MKYLLLTIALGVLAGCATMPSPQAATVKIATVDSVRSCNLLGTVFGTSGFGNMVAESVGIPNAKNEALEHAVRLGATDVVWQSEVGEVWASDASGNTAMGTIGSSVVGLAYRCEG